MRSPDRKKNAPTPDNLPLASILDSLDEAIQILDADWHFFYINQATADFVGKIALDMRGRNVWEEFPELVGSLFEDNCRRAMEEQVRINFEFYHPQLAKWFELHLHPSARYLTILATDVTCRVQAESSVEHQAELESLNARLHYRVEELRSMSEALTLSNVRQHETSEISESQNNRLRRAMQESHHRIKNNLQVVAALVEMQIGETGAATSDDYLRRIYQHMRALASIHDLLTQQVKETAENATLGTRQILGRLIPLLQETSGGRRVTADIADIAFPVQKAVSLSLLVSECVSNAFKHCKGVVEITLRVEGDTVCLEVCDDGNGFAPNFDWCKSANTGLMLIDSTARHDLRGQVRYDNHSDGGRVSIIFPTPSLS